jgi:hypothetical protein
VRFLGGGKITEVQNPDSENRTRASPLAKKDKKTVRTAKSSTRVTAVQLARY